jgi:AraC-like DNA-binding protein
VDYTKVAFQVGSCQGLILALLLFSRKKNRKSNLLLGLLILLLVTMFIQIWAYVPGITHPFFFYWPFYISFLFGPLQYLYVKYFLSVDRGWHARDLLWLLPTVCMIIYFIPFFGKPVSEQLRIANASAYLNHDEYYSIHFINAIIGVGCSLLSLKELRKFRQNLYDNYSKSDAAAMRWLTTTTYLALVVWIIYLPKPILGILNVLQPVNFSLIAYFLNVGLLYVISFKALSQPEVVFYEGYSGNLKQDVQVETKKYSRSGLSDIERKRIAGEIVDFLESKRSYLNPELTVDDLSISLAISRHYITEAVNIELSRNFYQLINEYRVQEIKSRLTNPAYQHYTLLAIAMDSGFSSKASFNSVFKKITGLTPSQYKANLATEKTEGEKFPSI